MDFIYAARRIFDSLSHSYQIYLAAISCKLKEFLATIPSNFGIALTIASGVFTL